MPSCYESNNARAKRLNVVNTFVTWFPLVSLELFCNALTIVGQWENWGHRSFFVPADRLSIRSHVDRNKTVPMFRSLLSLSINLRVKRLKAHNFTRRPTNISSNHRCYVIAGSVRDEIRIERILSPRVIALNYFVMSAIVLFAFRHYWRGYPTLLMKRD